ncbi:hypothetical protein EPI10_028817 [Gossypium australe]|uniref:Uncharacterized protein n=1 Tax=Gossypium australe TaxID=47621 RepID=A0A5B6UYZ7_9ROSI|nr:hypothetical protein EPI10_028817 [Gossypium australe]
MLWLHIKASYGRRCRTLICWPKLSERMVVESKLIQEVENVVKLIKVEEIEVHDDLSYEEKSVEILAREVKELRNK